QTPGPPEVAAGAGRVDGDVAEFAAVAAPAAQRPAVGDDARADAQLAGQVDHVRGARGRAGRDLRRDREVGVVLDGDRVGRVAERLQQVRAQRHVRPAEVGRE